MLAYRDVLSQVNERVMFKICLEYWAKLAADLCDSSPFSSLRPPCRPPVRRKKHFLLFHDLNRALELPAGVPAIYPSSLLLHSNFSLVEAGSKEAAERGEGRPRGSLVWFTQANFLVSRELEMTIAEAKRRGEKSRFRAKKAAGLFKA